MHAPLGVGSNAGVAYVNRNGFVSDNLNAWQHSEPQRGNDAPEWPPPLGGPLIYNPPSPVCSEGVRCAGSVTRRRQFWLLCSRFRPLERQFRFLAIPSQCQCQTTICLSKQRSSSNSSLCNHNILDNFIQRDLLSSDKTPYTNDVQATAIMLTIIEGFVSCN